jgi:guanylate kinase
VTRSDPGARPTPRTRLTVLAGPTAVGKGSVSADIRAHHPEIWISISATTRAPRPGEQNGVHYWFVSEAEFDRMIAEDEFLEWAVVHRAARYGTPRAPVEEMLAAGRPALLEIDLQGARQVQAAMPEALMVFLAPPSWDELVRRLVGRGTEAQDERERRLATARLELAAEAEFDRMVAEDELLEWAVVHRAARYGTPRAPVEEMLAAGRPALLEIDLQGARQVHAAMPEALMVFLAPPSWDELVRRLIGRGTEDQEEREQRLASARLELAAEAEFDVTIVNTEIHDAAEELVAFMVGPPGRS